MAFLAANLIRVGGGDANNMYMYYTDDATTTIDGDGYMNNSDDGLNLQIGDLVFAIVASAITDPLTAIDDVGLFVVVAVNSSTGAVNLSDDLLGATVTYGD